MEKKPPHPRNIAFWLGTGLGSGLTPKAPGTAGSLAALPFIYGAGLIAGPTGIAAFLLIWIAASLFTAPGFERAYSDDPALFVADEWAGQAVPFIGISFTGSLATDIPILLAGFILFRIFDITKPLGIKKAEKLPSPLGILADDLLAGLYALLLLKLLIMFL
ncbi:phosphatidylglycerophosphatase A family protein [Cyclonatronum proteinivorum]|uniref:phosphatidylglycerophosphatase A family protein n=1 Tax=Cyclonatronum proteinivorum TaxID=1457365 RepID=UPI001F0BD918|nr:phosphatidylglycerophosphatase A [Cyclonatronum proteinivorum]